MSVENLNPGHPVSQLAQEEAVKLLGIVLNKLGVDEIEITDQDILALDRAIVHDSRNDRYVVRLIPMEEALRLAAEEPGAQVEQAGPFRIPGDEQIFEASERVAQLVAEYPDIYLIVCIGEIGKDISSTSTFYNRYPGAHHMLPAAEGLCDAVYQEARQQDAAGIERLMRRRQAAALLASMPPQGGRSC